MAQFLSKDAELTLRLAQAMTTRALPVNSSAPPTGGTVAYEPVASTSLSYSKVVLRACIRRFSRSMLLTIEPR